MAVVKLAKIII